MKMILGQKLGMSQVFMTDGNVVPVTLVVAKPNPVTLRRSKEKDGYAAVQVELPGRAKREFKGEVAEDVKEVSVGQFTEGDIVSVAGVSKGKGFQGVVKRHGFKGGPASHGHTDWERRPGSIGQRFPQHTIKGKKMAGRMGADRVTVKNLEIIRIDAENNLLAIKGAVPGRRGSVLEIRSI